MLWTLLHLKPGRRRTKQVLAQNGDRLVYVPYRDDEPGKKRFKAVELIVAERMYETAIPASFDWRAYWGTYELG